MFNNNPFSCFSAMVSQAVQLLPAHRLNGSSPSQLSLMNVEGGAAEKMAALLGK
mgnify:FL=1